MTNVTHSDLLTHLTRDPLSSLRQTDRPRYNGNIRPHLILLIAMRATTVGILLSLGIGNESVPKIIINDTINSLFNYNQRFANFKP